MDTKYFHFTIGPVQGFVSQARRTRDFWAGSFILSWLAGVAMQSVKIQGGTVVFPKPNEEKNPKQGNIPNRFKAKVTNNFKPESVINDVKAAWKALAEEVWKNDLEKHCRKYLKTRTIWDEQVNSFWDMSWALTEDEKASDLLDKRKNLRSYYTPEQEGVKCTVMGEWQELSGSFPVNKEFWKNLKISNSELREGEHLCAIAFIKRRFHSSFGQLSNGWQVHDSVPSVYDMAIVHWLEKLLLSKELNKTLIDKFVETAKSLEFDNQATTKINCLKQFGNHKLLGYDASVFFENDLLVNYSSSEIEKDKKIEIENKRKDHIQNLKELYKIVGKKPSPFYAVLMMDGDSLGSKMSNSDNQESISTALNNFTKKVPSLVEEKNGFLIYAGGDDVLAILPLEDALTCAAKIRKFYLEKFKETKNPNIANSTISAAIEFVHIKEPLTMVLKDAHKLLDDIAKEQCGRDSIAVRVWKGSGKALEWAMPFECALKESKFEIERIANEFRDKKNEQKEADFSSKFFYKIREHFDILNPQKEGEDRLLSDGDAIQLLAADYLNSGVNRGKTKENTLTLQEAQDKIKPLLEQCRPVKRDAEKPKENWKKSDLLEVDGALLVRFLAQNWQQKD